MPGDLPRLRRGPDPDRPGPDQAILDDEMRGALLRLRDRWPVAVVSGRDLQDVRGRVGVDGVAYAGSHGFEIVTPGGRQELKGEDYLPDLDAAEGKLREALPGGARLERKRAAIAVHVRGMEADEIPGVERVVDEVAARHTRLRVTGGKRIFELRPDLDWDKGRALRWFLEVLGLTDAVPVYVGDDLTDEDAFQEIREDGLGVVVRGEHDERPTLAHAALDGPDEVRGFLEALADL
ncbi:MAG TPA: trehalose-phosphatase [Actinomycetota bacterium]